MATDLEKNAMPAADTTTSGTAKHDADNDASYIETLEHAAPGYANDRSSDVVKEIAEDEENNPHIHQQVRSPGNFDHGDLLLNPGLRCHGPSSRP